MVQVQVQVQVQCSPAQPGPVQSSPVQSRYACFVLDDFLAAFRPGMSVYTRISAAAQDSLPDAADRFRKDDRESVSSYRDCFISAE